jgi:hypothetical protein
VFFELAVFLDDVAPGGEAQNHASAVRVDRFHHSIVPRGSSVSIRSFGHVCSVAGAWVNALCRFVELAE